jgi:hypothetical protein
MNPLCIYIVGTSLIADTLEDLLVKSSLVSRLARFPSVASALSWIDSEPPNLLFIVDIEDSFIVGHTPFLPMCPDIPVLCLDMNENTLKLITTNQIQANTSEMLAVVQSLVEAV